MTRLPIASLPICPRAESRAASQRLPARAARGVGGLLVLAFVVQLAGCPPAVTPHPDQVEPMCAALCKRRAECQAGDYDQKNCAHACRELRSKRAQWLRSDYVGAVTECYSALACEHVLEMSAEQACRDSATTRIGATPAATRACEKIVAHDHACGPETTQAACLDDFVAFRDDALDAIGYCNEISTCWKATRCVRDALGENPDRRAQRPKKKK